MKRKVVKEIITDQQSDIIGLNEIKIKHDDETDEHKKKYELTDS